MTIKQEFKTEWYAWRNMIARCYYKNIPNYHRYGGRGIKVCDEWLGEDGFRNFIEAMGLRPNKEYSLDRIDNNGNYEPSNCRWTTMKEQSNNQEKNIKITYRGLTKTLAEWADYTGMNYDHIRSRYRKGWDTKSILESPKGKNHVERKTNSKSHTLTYNGETLTVAQWAKKLGVSYEVLRSRKRYGWSDERTLTEFAKKSELYPGRSGLFVG